MATKTEIAKALDLALARLIVFEPPDSRAVSDEFVAVADVAAGNPCPASLRIIDAALAVERAKAA